MLKIIGLNSLYSIYKYLIFSVIRFVWYTGRKIRWSINGASQLVDTYETSAHVEKVLWRCKLSVYHNTKVYHFLGCHEKFDHPRRVLNDNVVLMHVNNRAAFFLETEDSVWRYAADKTPFLWYTLFQKAKRCITIPLASFHRLADTLGDPALPSLIISNQGRCGSTLICKVLQLANTKVLTLSEPDTFASLMQLLPQKEEKNFGGRGFDQLIQSAVRIQFKPVSNADAVVIKDRLMSLRIIKYIYTVCPYVKHVYMKRANTLKTVTSWQTAFMAVGEWQFFWLLTKCGLLKPSLLPYLGVRNEDTLHVLRNGLKNLDMADIFEFMLCCWAENATAYADAKKSVPFYTIDYEDLLKTPETILKAVFQMINRQPTSLKDALEVGFKGDSQKGTPLAWEYTHSRKPIKLTPARKRRADLFLDSLGLSSINLDR